MTQLNQSVALNGATPTFSGFRLFFRNSDLKSTSNVLVKRLRALIELAVDRAFSIEHFHFPNQQGIDR